MSKGPIRHVGPWEAVLPGWLVRGNATVTRLVRYGAGFAIGLLVADLFAPAVISWIAGSLLVVALVWLVVSRVIRAGALRQLRSVLGTNDVPRGAYQLVGTGEYMIWVEKGPLR